MSQQIQTSINANQRLSTLYKSWFVIVFVGQMLFVIYIFGQYFIKGVLGKFGDWADSSTGGYVQGDTIGNVAFVAHVIIAGIITLGGPLQLISGVRKRFPIFHRWNGRVYVVTGVVTSLAGFYLTWVRGTVGDFQAHVMTSINGLLIIITAVFTVKYAMSGQFQKHQRWAVRLFIAMSGVFFFRVFLNFWLIVSQGKGIDFDSFTGVALDVIGFCSYIAPLLLLEFFYTTLKSRNAFIKQIASVSVVMLILIFAVGTIGAAFLMWWPVVMN